MKQPTWNEWNAWTIDEQRRHAEALAKSLPTGFIFEGLQAFDIAERRLTVARYRRADGARFSFVPGGPLQLGFDASKWAPNPDEAQSWRDTAEEYGIERSVEEHVGLATLPPRDAALPPLLVEAEPAEVGWRPWPVDSPEVRELVRAHGRRGGNGWSVEQVGREASLRVRGTPEGLITAERGEPPVHGAITAEVSRGGFRLPTSDEWEHACAAGARTLFRWGDHGPMHRYPTDAAAEEEGASAAFHTDWDLERRPNALGLRIAYDPYKMEVVAEPDRVRGGDGGGMICGGAGYFIGWLTLASAYFEPDVVGRDGAEPLPLGYAVARRVLEL